MGVIQKRAINLVTGDECIGPSIDFTDRGVVRTIVAVDSGIQVCWVGGTHTIRPEDYLFLVKEKGYAGAAAQARAEQVAQGQRRRRKHRGS